jgi:hypothetical protein
MRWGVTEIPVVGWRVLFQMIAGGVDDERIELGCGCPRYGYSMTVRVALLNPHP